MHSHGSDHASGFVLCGARLFARDRPDRHRGRPPRCAMIAVVKGWHAVFSALLFFLPRGAAAAEGPIGAARELARKTAAFAGRGEAVSASWRNISSLTSGDFNQVRGLFETALREAGARTSETAAAEAQIMVSENGLYYLLVVDARKGE